MRGKNEEERGQECLLLLKKKKRSDVKMMKRGCKDFAHEEGGEVKSQITNRICPWDIAYVSCFTYKKKRSFRDPTPHRKGTTGEVTDLQEQGGFAVCGMQRTPVCKKINFALDWTSFFPRLSAWQYKGS